MTWLAIDHLGFRVKRETYVGPWLPEPIVTAEGRDPVDPAVLVESLSTAFLLMLERLAPLERAVFLLRKVFDLQHPEVASMVDRSPPARRQIAKRARERIAAGRPRSEARAEEAERLAEGFLAACREGAVEAFLPLLSDDVVAWSDSGGRVPAARRPVVGSDHCARFWAGRSRKGFDRMRIQRVRVNGGPAFVLRPREGPVRVIGFSAVRGRIREIYIFSNPDRLGRMPVEE